VAWIHAELLGGTPTDVLDLGCGPGLYTERLAALGHRCVGIDVSPASIAFARARAAFPRARAAFAARAARRPLATDCATSRATSAASTSATGTAWR
jgi:2-polyprenyl-3-methyl-5-hydroxy-6-metoxy-1,4-benzoquinol methylase